MRDAPDLDLGSGVTLSWTSFSPDRELNPKWVDVPDEPRFGALIEHPNPRTETGRCCGHVYLDGPVTRRVLSDPERRIWAVQSWDPLTISPSVLCRGRNTDGTECGFHGFIRDGKWVPA